MDRGNGLWEVDPVFRPGTDRGETDASAQKRTTKARQLRGTQWRGTEMMMYLSNQNRFVRLITRLRLPTPDSRLTVVLRRDLGDLWLLDLVVPSLLLGLRGISNCFALGRHTPVGHIGDLSIWETSPRTAITTLTTGWLRVTRWASGDRAVRA
jgi:hypothetical protein